VELSREKPLWPVRLGHPNEGDALKILAQREGRAENMFNVSCRYGGPVGRERTGYDFQLSREVETAIRIVR
jgi:hypothetical protein